MSLECFVCGFIVLPRSRCWLISLEVLLMRPSDIWFARTELSLSLSASGSYKNY